MTSPATAVPGALARAHLGLRQYAICMAGIIWREGLRFLHQRERFISALVRPLVWLFI
ncbi:MAG: multidrug ABC transporter permease, partial [Methylobacteriaceae bacterium]|nr:multidrug ABC transporter permease [Methylobacteriaceae bacterium]